MVIIGEAVSRIVSNMIQDDSFLAGIRRINPHGPHGLLNIEGQGFSWPEQLNSFTVRNIKTLAK